MEQVVRRILVWQIKPGSKPRKVYLAEEGIKPTWLPKIANVEFVLMDQNAVAGREGGVYFFTQPRYISRRYSIGFAHGDPNCLSDGAWWFFALPVSAFVYGQQPADGTANARLVLVWGEMLRSKYAG